MIKFLDLQKITAKYADEIKEAISNVVDSGASQPGNSSTQKPFAYQMRQQVPD